MRTSVLGRAHDLDEEPDGDSDRLTGLDEMPGESTPAGFEGYAVEYDEQFVLLPPTAARLPS